MMVCFKNFQILLIFFVLTNLLFTSSQSQAKLNRPKLVLVLVIDQFRSDYLSRFENQFLPAFQKSGELGGFKYLLSQSAFLPLSQFNTLQNITASGHATLLSGAYPYQTGIPLNEWFNPNTQEVVYSTDDPDSPIIGSQGVESAKKGSAPDSIVPDPDSLAIHAGMSPKNLRATTVGDELKNAGFSSKIVSIALKHRSSILLGGHRADLALWYDTDSNEWVSSRYYLKNSELPHWVIELNKKVKAQKGQTFEWKPLSNGKGPSDESFFPGLGKTQFTQKGSSKSLATPYGVELTFDAAQQALSAYPWGQGPATDLLAISLSSHDKVGHCFGPNSRPIEEITLAQDRMLAKFLNQVRKKIPGGLKDVLILLTADHGVSPSPDWLKKNGLDAGVLDLEELSQSISRRIDEKFGKPAQGNWVSKALYFHFYLNHSEILSKKLDLSLVEFEAKAELLKNPKIAYVLTSTDFELRRLPPGIFELQALHSYVPGRSGHLIIVPRPFYLPKNDVFQLGATTHLTGYSYDRTIPILLSGHHIQPGIYPTQAQAIDIAPTLSFLLGIIPPSLSEGRTLSEIIDLNSLRSTK